MLSAIPSTPLYDRLAAANRLDLSEHPTYGTNVLPLQMSRETLSDGYVALMASLYEPQAFFARLDDLYLAGRIEVDRAWQRDAETRPWPRRLRQLQTWWIALAVMAAVAIRVPDKSLRAIYLRRFWRAARARRSPVVALIYAFRCAIHYHMHRLVETLSARDRPLVNTF
jgi:hypothetical protein